MSWCKLAVDIHGSKGKAALAGGNRPREVPSARRVHWQSSSDFTLVDMYFSVIVSLLLVQLSVAQFDFFGNMFAQQQQQQQQQNSGVSQWETHSASGMIDSFKIQIVNVFLTWI